MFYLKVHLHLILKLRVHLSLRLKVHMVVHLLVHKSSQNSSIKGESEEVLYVPLEVALKISL